MTSRRSFLKRAGAAGAAVLLAAVAAPDWCTRSRRPGSSGACRRYAWVPRSPSIVIKPSIALVQQGGERRDGDRALFRGPARADRRALPGQCSGAPCDADPVGRRSRSPRQCRHLGVFDQGTSPSPFSRYSLDVRTALFHQWGLNRDLGGSRTCEVDRAGRRAQRVCAWDPCHLQHAGNPYQRSLERPQGPGRRVHLPERHRPAVRSRAVGVVPVTLDAGERTSMVRGTDRS